MTKQTLEKLATETSQPCLTISLNTHRTHPDNVQDGIVLKNLIKDAENRLIDEFGKRPIASLLEKLETLTDEVDLNHNLDSLHIFLSNDTKEILRSTWPAGADQIHIAETFAVRPIIKDFNRSVNYYILVLSQGGVQLYLAQNDAIQTEVRNDNFPFSENRHYHTDSLKKSDGESADNQVREFLNKVDKAVVNVYNQEPHQVYVICTEDNHARLMQVADRPAIYSGYSAINYNDTAQHSLAAQAWEMVKEDQHQKRSEAIGEMKEAVAHGNVLTDIAEIYRAAKEGRADLLIVHNEFQQPARHVDDWTIEVVDDATLPEVNDDIVSDIAWSTISMNGRVIFTNQDEIKDLGDMVLKVRY